MAFIKNKADDVVKPGNPYHQNKGNGVLRDYKICARQRYTVRIFKTNGNEL